MLVFKDCVRAPKLPADHVNAASQSHRAEVGSRTSGGHLAQTAGPAAPRAGCPAPRPGGCWRPPRGAPSPSLGCGLGLRGDWAWAQHSFSAQTGCPSGTFSAFQTSQGSRSTTLPWHHPASTARRGRHGWARGRDDSHRRVGSSARSTNGAHHNYSHGFRGTPQQHFNICLRERLHWK